MHLLEFSYHWKTLDYVISSFSCIVPFVSCHTLLKAIPLKEDRHRAASELNSDLAALFQFGKLWFIDFSPLKTKSLKAGHH